MRKFLIALFAICVCSLAWGAEKSPALKHLIQADAPYGSATYRTCFTTVYDATLWTDAPQWSWDVPFALSIFYHLSVEGKKLSENSIELMNKISPLSADAKMAYANKLDILFPDVNNGDDITAYYDPDKGVSFYYNGISIGKIDDLIFARRFLEIWLSEKTSEPEQRQKLLAHNINQQGE